MAALATVVIATLITSNPAKSVDFGQQEVDQNKFIAVASPYGAHRYQLFIFEHIYLTNDAPVTLESLNSVESGN